MDLPALRLQPGGIRKILSEHLAKVDPLKDGWNTEHFSEAAKDQLKKLGHFLTRAGDSDPQAAAAVIAPGFSCEPLRPADVHEVFSDGAFAVFRADPRSSHPTPQLGGPHRGLAGLVDTLRSWCEGGGEGMAKIQPVQVDFKIFQVHESGPEVSTTVFVELSGAMDRGHFQKNATWHCLWKRPENDEPPRLEWIDVADYEEVVYRGPGGEAACSTLFADCTESALAKNPCFKEQILLGQSYWVRRLEAKLGIDVTGHSGLAVGDADGDGLDDVLLCQPGGLPNRLFLHQPDGTLIDASAAAGVDWLDHTRSALFVDLDNDGDQDLAIAFANLLLVMSNDGSGHFAKEAVLAAEGAHSLAAADYDQDGKLDLYVTCYPNLSPVPYHDANNGLPNLLYRNRGNWMFNEVTREKGLDQNNRRFSFAAAWEDYDNDGDLDLYVANDYGRNNLYRNDGGRFTDVAAAAGVEDIAAGMGVAWADFNHDGFMDLHVSNMFSTAGNRIAYQRRFKDSAPEQAKSIFQRHARGDSLFANLGDGTFADVSLEAAITMGRWAWDAKFADLNNDSWEDLLVANGYITNEDPGDL
ncbi:MAG: VCBS repeat-containing protein [Planctomycetes bacterium]|nr:VCBS repeat-containing protein [Planctomycetota bacterium]